MNNEQSADETIQLFFNKIDQWVNNIGINKKRLNYEECEEILNLSVSDLDEESQDSLLKKAYILYGYADALSGEYNHQKMIFDYADQSILYIVSPVLNNYGDQYTKFDIKYNLAIRENPLAKKLNLLKNNAAARLNVINDKASHIKKMADIMIEISRRKKNDYYSNS